MCELLLYYASQYICVCIYMYVYYTEISFIDIKFENITYIYLYIYINIELVRFRLFQKEISISFLEILNFAKEFPIAGDS